MFTLIDISALTNVLPYLWMAALYSLAFFVLAEASPLHVHHAHHMVNNHALGDKRARSH